MTENYSPEYEQLLHQIHADVFLKRLRDYVDLDGDIPEKVTSDLNDLSQRLLIEDSSPSIGSDDLEMLLKDDEIRDQLKQSIRHLIKSQPKEET